MHIVLAGFGPFPGAPFNPSAALAQLIARRQRPALAGHLRTVHVFATSYACVDRDMPKLFATDPDIVLIFGLAGRRRHVCIETRARNAVSLLFPDANGYRPSKSVIKSGGPDMLIGRAPFARLLGAVRVSRLPGRLSRDAGRYLCNYAFWRALERTSDGRPLVQFIHIPPLGRNSQPLRRSTRHPPSLAQLASAAESVLIALIAASRR